MLLLLLLPLVAARIHALPEDPSSSPKYKVEFLNHLPLENDTAQRWLATGLRGGVREFLEQPWDDSWHPPALGNGDDEQVTFGVADEDVSLASTPDVRDEYSLEQLKMGPDEYLCLIPKPLEQPPQEDEPEEVPTPAHSWSLLLPLTGSCLYHRQAWFTYSYCHNEEIRQFRELIQARPLPTGSHRPEEDPEASQDCWESYTLGRAPPAPESGADLTVAQQDAVAANLELARSAGSSYLVQRWGDGTLCDKTGKPREVEVQFHCSMATTDTIAFVKESRTCAYVLVIHTPRLCGEPGFMSKDVGEQASIACREVVTGVTADRSDAAFLRDTDHPLKMPRRKLVLPAPPALAPGTAKDGTGASGKYTDVIRKALDTIKELKWGSSDLEMVDDGEGNVVIQFVDDIPFDDVNPAVVAAEDDARADRIVDILREAGMDIQKTGKVGTNNDNKNKKKKNGDEKQAGDAADRRREVDELL
ncbi:hypothetical protein C8R46DRAFT_1032546 [Mycena filopes]|nr:hypothetical protein C8R46DRAFT_1032546 [Mycena filopes]